MYMSPIYGDVNWEKLSFAYNIHKKKNDELRKKAIHKTKQKLLHNIITMQNIIYT